MDMSGRLMALSEVANMTKAERNDRQIVSVPQHELKAVQAMTPEARVAWHAVRYRDKEAGRKARNKRKAQRRARRENR